MKTNHLTMKAALLTAALLVCGAGANAATKVTVGVGHMCCDGCKNAAKAALEEVASEVTIDGKNVTVTLKEGDNIVPVLVSLRRGGFPANRIDAGSSPVTLTVRHLCCGGCKNALSKALADSKIEALDTDAVKVGEDSVTVKAKDGKSLDLAPVLTAMEKGGFSASKVVIGTAAAKSKAGTKKVVRR